MRKRVHGILIGALFCIAGTAFGQSSDDPDPLFIDDTVLEVRISAPLDSLMKTRPVNEYLPGELTFTDSDGSSRTVVAGLQTRGNYRRQRDVCPFAPLRLNLKKSEVKGTLFDKQDKLKLVTHCKDRADRYQQGVFREYIAYRILNLLTDVSYRVRLLKITWENTEDPDEDMLTYGFLIEPDERLAKRTGLPEFEVSRTRVANLVPAYTNLTSVFQYLLGNTDYSQIAGPKDETCCHNSTLFGDLGGKLYAVPYDFDMSGLVNAKYATPNPRFEIRSVRERLYRGRCAFNSELPATLQLIGRNKSAIYALLEERVELDKRSRTEMSRFIDAFFDVIENPERVQRELGKNCTS
jgi:hypothetical protein